MKNNKHVWMSVVVGLVIAGGVFASNVTLPNTFQPNTPAVASQVNANFAAVKAAVDDNQAQINALKGTRIIRRSPVAFTFPATGANTLQGTQVDVPLMTATASGVLEVSLDVGDVNASYSSSTPEWSLRMTPLLNGTAGSPVFVANCPLGCAIRPPLSGRTAFAVSSGQVVSLRVYLETFPSCQSGRGASTTCSLEGLSINAHFTPGVVLE